MELETGHRMKIEDSIRERARTLIDDGRKIGISKPQYSEPAGRAILQKCNGWLASARNLISVIHPNPLSAYATRANFVTGPVTDQVGSVAYILEELLVDVDAGVARKVADAARAEVFDDFLDQAAYYLKHNKVPQAGVVAGVVFEDSLRKVAANKGHVQKGENVEQLIINLVKDGTFTEVKAKRARVAAGVRTQATHAQWDEFDRADVESCIAFSRELVETYLA